jgi:hypothetical protein
MSSSSPVVVCPETNSKLSIMASKTFSSTEPSIPHGYVNKNACGGELRSISFSKLFSKAQSKQKMYNMICTRESALCKLRKKYRA